MTGQKFNGFMLLFVLSVSLIATSLTAVLLTNYYKHTQFEAMGAFCGEIIRIQPDTEQTILEVLKKKDYTTISADENILQAFGYQPSDFVQDNSKALWNNAWIGFIFGAITFLLSYWCWHKKITYRIRMLTDYLEKVNTGSQGLLLETSDDDFSRLQDGLYKTVTTLYQTREAALEAKNNFADNLSNIAHQLKTPITAISLATQMMKCNPSSEYPGQIQRQLNRLTHLEEALLLLSRIDAGTLALKRTSVDVFTVLTLASDHLQELFAQTRVSIDIPEMGEVEINTDLDWTMEAIMNLMKNCMEHSPEGSVVHCSYEANPLYVQIRIWDEGQGFAKEELPHLFERFYRGKNAKDGSIGIGLSLVKAIIEMQNGILSANNLSTGGACFEIRFYRH